MTSDEIPNSLDGLLQYLREVRAFDFTGYKRATLTRRVDKRMQQLGITDHADYVDYLQVHPDEFEQLFNTILINVTSTRCANGSPRSPSGRKGARSACGAQDAPPAKRRTRR
jgi:hypothetical protein